MSSPFQGIDIASTAMRAMQDAISVTGNNVANMNTVGYSRQTISFAEYNPTQFYSIGAQGAISLGNGVGVNAVTRVRDMYLQARANSNQSDLGQTNQLLADSQNIQATFNEPGSGGISNALSAFYNSWSALSSTPSSAAARIQVQQAGSTLATRIQTTYQNIQTIQQQTGQSIQQTISTIQSDANQIANLNTQIRQASATGATPNDLLDQRDQVIQNLSQLVDINTQQFSDGSISVNVNQFNLVSESGANTFPTSFNAATNTVSDANGTYSIRNGQLAGQFATINSATSYMGQLDNLANTLRTTVNGLHTTGTTANGTTGQNFFNSALTGAGNLALDPAVAADPNNIASGTTSASGDGGIATAIANIQNVNQAGLGNVSITTYYNNLVTNVGSITQSYQTTQSTQNAVQQQIQQQVQSASGVNIDEEMTNMLKYQQSYQAAAKALSIADQTTQALINLIQ